MLNNLINKINELEERIFETEEDTITEKDINEYGFVLVRSNILLAINGLAIAMAGMLQFDSIDHYVPLIVVDDRFMNMSDNGKRFTIAHELGHFEYHMHKVTNPEYVRDIHDEYEADEYSAKQIGYQSAIFGLEELQEVLDITSDGLNVEGIQECEIRIQNLLSKSMVTC